MNTQKLPFMIEGHTDSSGPKAFNQKLSELRAMTVKEYLVENGITSSRLMTSWIRRRQTKGFK